MGSGCNTNCNDLFGPRKPDGSIEYTGPGIPGLGICTGDTLPEVLAVLLQRIIDYSTGVNITMVDIDLTTCDAFVDCLTCCGTCQDLPCLLECYKNAICEVYNLVRDAFGPYDTKCLSGVNSSSTLGQVLQALIDAHCALVTTVANLQTQVNNIQTQVTNINNNLTTNIGNFMLGAISSCQGSSGVRETGTGASAQFSFQGFVPVGSVIAYAGNTAGKFDSNGLGIAGTDACGFALANGNIHTVAGITYTTIDMREQVPVGVGAGTMGGGALQPNTSGANYSFGQQVGQAFVTLTANQSGLPGHSHSLTIAPHSHRFRFTQKSANDNNSLGGSHPDSYMGFGGDDIASRYFYEPPVGTAGGPSYVYVTEDFGVNTGVAGATFGEIGASGPDNARDSHENRQPSTALLYIQRLY